MHHGGRFFPQAVDLFPGATENPHKVEISSEGSGFPQAVGFFPGPGVTENPHEVDISFDFPHVPVPRPPEDSLRAPRGRLRPLRISTETSDISTCWGNPHLRREGARASAFAKVIVVIAHDLTPA